MYDHEMLLKQSDCVSNVFTCIDRKIADVLKFYDRKTRTQQFQHDQRVQSTIRYQLTIKVQSYST